MEQSCVGRRIEWSNPALAAGLSGAILRWHRIETRRGSGCSDAGQVARPGGGCRVGGHRSRASPPSHTDHTDHTVIRWRLALRVRNWSLHPGAPPARRRSLSLLKFSSFIADHCRPGRCREASTPGWLQVYDNKAPAVVQVPCPSSAGELGQVALQEGNT